MVRPVMYWSFAKRSMTSSMDLNMQRNPRARRLASERTLTHGLGQDNQSRAGARRVRGSDGGSARLPRDGLRIVLAVVFLPEDVAARLVLFVTDRAPLLPGDLPVGGGLLAVRLYLLLLRLELGRLLRRHLPAPDALLDAGVLALLAPVDDAGGRQGGREHEGGDDDRESLHGGLLSISAADFEMQRVHWPRGANGLRSSRCAPSPPSSVPSPPGRSSSPPTATSTSRGRRHRRRFSARRRRGLSAVATSQPAAPGWASPRRGSWPACSIAGARRRPIRPAARAASSASTCSAARARPRRRRAPRPSRPAATTPSTCCSPTGARHSW